MHWGVFAISAAHLYLPKLPWRAPSPNPHETSERMNFNEIDQIYLIWKLFIYWYLMSFFHNKNVTKCFGHHYAIWTSDSDFFTGPKFFVSGRPKAGPHFKHCNTWYGCHMYCHYSICLGCWTLDITNVQCCEVSKIRRFYSVAGNEIVIPSCRIPIIKWLHKISRYCSFSFKYWLIRILIIIFVIKYTNNEKPLRITGVFCVCNISVADILYHIKLCRVHLDTDKTRTHKP